MELRNSCAHIMNNGNTCGAYALEDSELCYWHHKARKTRDDRKRLNRSRRLKTSGLVLPFLEDANSIQFAIQMIAQAVADRQISRSESGALLYAVQLAITNLKKVERPENICTFQTRWVPTNGDDHEDLFPGLTIPKACDPRFDDEDEDDDDEEQDDERDDVKSPNDNDENVQEDEDEEEDEGSAQDEAGENENTGHGHNSSGLPANSQTPPNEKLAEAISSDDAVNQEEIEYAVAFVRKNMAKLIRLGLLSKDSVA